MSNVDAKKYLQKTGRTFMKSQSRLLFLDLLRGWALLTMIEVHVFNAFIIPEYKMTSWFHVLNFINGLVAPSFTFISGFVFLLASQKKIDSFRNYGSAFWKQLGRIGMIWMIGYCLHLPFFSFRRTMTETSDAGWLKFYQSDVLHCIAFGLLVLFLLRLLIKSDRVYRMTLLASGLGVVITTLFIWNIDFLAMVPAPLAAYLNSQHYSLFPLFPWVAFIFFGGYFALSFIQARELNKEREYILRFALIGAIMFDIGIIFIKLPTYFQIGSSDIRSNPLFFFERLGIIMLLLTCCWFYGEYKKSENSFVANVSRESLMVYATHLLVIYGQFWNEKSLSFYYGKSFNVWECIGATVFLILLMIGTAMLWGWVKRYHRPIASVMFWMFSITSTAWFFMH